MKQMNKKIGNCVKGGAAGLLVGVAVALATTNKCAAGVCLKKNLNKMTKAAYGMVDSLKMMIR